MSGAAAPVDLLVLDAVAERHGTYRDLLSGLARQVVTALPGEEARQLLSGGNFGAVLVNLDGGADADLADIVRAPSLPSGAPLIVISERRPERGADAGALAGAVDYVPAAFARELLAERVSCVLELRRLRAERIGDLDRISALTSEVQRLSGAVAEEKRAADALRQRLEEQIHRSKNLLAMLQSVAMRTVSDGRAIPEAREALMGRFRALARAHQLVTSTEGAGVEIADAVETALADIAGRVTASGPPVRLTGSVAQTFMLALHELAVNAVRHGALRTDEGTVSLGWTFFEHGAERYLEVAWSEHGGGPAEVPAHYGFGLTLVSSFSAARAPAPNVSFDAGGVTCRMRLSHDMIASG